MKNIINTFKSPDGLIEICEMPEGELAGRTKIIMSALEIHQDENSFNKNGINWNEQYVLDNLDSIISAPFVVCWYDKENQIPSDHGTMSFDEEGNVQFEGVTVGSIQTAYIEDREINGINKRVLTCEGVIYNQRYPLFTKWLKEEISKGTIYGSIEINGRGKNKKIKYDGEYKNDDGTLKQARKPRIFDFSGLAILSSLFTPADDSSQVIEVNNINKSEDKDGENKDMKVELNELNFDDIATLVENGFNKKFNENKNDFTWFYVHKFYPTISTFIMRSWSKVGEYYQSTYLIEKSKVIIGDIVKVEESWKPVDGVNAVEINNTPINILKKSKEVKQDMDEKIVLELNQKIEEKVNEINSLNKDIETKVTEINSLNTKVTELDAKVSELSETIVEINKSLEAEKTEKEALTVEVNSFREEKSKQEAEGKKVEVNSYFETEIPKNGFDETEINSLKSFVDACDLDGLKRAEGELIIKKFKEQKTITSEVETNSMTFISTKKVDESKANTTLPTFFTNN